jgi:hypothetical protein
MTIKSRKLLLRTFGLAALGIMLTAELADATHPHPKGASPLQVPLVPAFKQCTASNRTHGAPLSFASCAPPAPTSSFLTVGTPDANGAAAKAVGSILIKVKATSPQDVLTTLTVTDVRCTPSTNASACNNANVAGGPDYSGDIQSNATIRVSDHYNGPNLNEAATVQDIPFPVNAPCTSTSDTSIGSTCSVTACATCMGPPRNDIGGQATVVGITQFQVSDGGPDGIVATSDNTLFMSEGVFIP